MAACYEPLDYEISTAAGKWVRSRCWNRDVLLSIVLDRTTAAICERRVGIRRIVCLASDTMTFPCPAMNKWTNRVCGAARPTRSPRRHFSPRSPRLRRQLFPAALSAVSVMFSSFKRCNFGELMTGRAINPRRWGEFVRDRLLTRSRKIHPKKSNG